MFHFTLAEALSLSLSYWWGKIQNMSNKILIVDDDAFIRDLYEEILKDEGFEVDIADNGETGLEKLLHGGYDLVLLDVMMPKLDGLGVLTKLKEAIPAPHNGPILLLTNLDHDPMLDQAKELGAHSHILKADLLPPDLIRVVKETTKIPS